MISSIVYKLNMYIYLIISYLIMTLGIIIYLEIVQINCFGLNTNTKEQIKRRTSIDIYQNISELPLDDEDENTIIE